MPTVTQFIVSALYVTFAYACLGIGALIYRKVIDDLNVKDVHLGEELLLLYDPRAFIAAGCFVFFFFIFVVIMVMKNDLLHEEVNRSAPGLLFLVIPLIILVNIVQILLRAKWQRTSVRTRGILVRRMFSENFYSIRYENHLCHLGIERESLWFKVLFLDEDKSLICTCRTSATGLILLVRSVLSATECEIHAGDIMLEY